MNLYCGKNNDYNPFNYYDDRDNMKTDITVKDGITKLYIEMPGFMRENIEISFDKGVLKVFAKRHEDNTDGKYLIKERCKRIEREYYFSSSANFDIKAQYSDGILEIALKNKASEKKYITIQ